MVIVLLAGLLSVPLPALARLNLPQTKQVVTLPDDTVRTLRTSLGSNTTTELPRAEEEVLLNALPQGFRASCGDMIENWGEIAKGTAQWRVRVLFTRGNQVWLAFRCGSRAPEYGKDFDERPALLRLDSGKLEFFPLGVDAENDSTLYHLEVAKVVPLDGVEGVAFSAMEPGLNPCCDGPESRSGESWRVFADSSHGVAELLSITTTRDDSSHSDDPEVDSETTYRAELKLERDSSRKVTGVTVTFREEIKDITWEGAKANPKIVSRRSGTLRYHWNPASRVFEEIK